MQRFTNFKRVFQRFRLIFHLSFLVSTDQNLVYNGHETRPLAAVIGDVPGLSMKGISKEFPWPGARCGWIEIYNRDRDPLFEAYVRSILNAKMVEVCSTTLPQRAIPRILQHPQYKTYLDDRRRRYERFSKTAYERFRDIPRAPHCLHRHPCTGHAFA